MRTSIKINEISLQILTDMIVKNEDSLFITCAKHMAKDLDDQIQQSRNLEEIGLLQQHFSTINKMLSHYTMSQTNTWA